MTKPEVVDHPRGEELERVMELDRKWFREHPDREWHIRYAHAVERFDMAHFGGGAIPYDKVLVVVVRRLNEGMRARWLVTMKGQGPYVFPDTDAEIAEMVDG